MRSLLAAFVLAGGCDVEQLRIVLFTQEQPEAIVSGSAHEDLVREAAAIVGFEVRFVTRRRGAVSLELLPPEAVDLAALRFGGRSLDRLGCDRSTWLVAVDAQRIAHELAHCLGLLRHQGDRNLMRGSPAPDYAPATGRARR